jgi:hypothetical protein
MMLQHTHFHHAAAFPRQATLPDKPLAYTDVYIDDFMLVAQRPHQELLMPHVLQCISAIFQDDADSPRRQVISQSKLDKGDATWSTTKRFLGWDIDTHTMTLRLPPHRLDRLNTLLTTFLALKRTSRTKWLKLLGELRSMASAIQGARFLFSVLQHVLVDQPGPRIRLSALVKTALRDWLHLATTLAP